MKHPQELTDEELRAANTLMTGHLEATVELVDSKQPGGFWLGASYLFWPNCPLNTTNRKKMSVEERREELLKWRDVPEVDAVLDAPCVLCGVAACGWFGKVDVPLAASVSYRNTTVPGHEGMALCRGCLLSFYALPYACVVSGGRAALIHSWDDEFLSETVGVQARRMLKRSVFSPGSSAVPAAKSMAYSRQRRVVEALRAYEGDLVDGVELMVFSNSNKEQELTVHAIDQPAAEWISASAYDRHKQGWVFLARAHHSPKVPGASMLARNLFDRPLWVVSSASSYLRDLTEKKTGVPGEGPALAQACFSYSTRVLMTTETDAAAIRQLARRIAETVDTEDAGELKKYFQAHRSPKGLRAWLRNKSTQHMLRSSSPEPFVTEQQWLLLFDSEERNYLHRDLLFVGMLAELHELAPAWRDDPEQRSALEEESGVNDDVDEKEED
ncbi:hypothetical protein [Nocardiopsis ansamitocini]|nr:hypothetical protein [Nocardiopsis ansamitocini]